jgi:hypothetical protein
MPRLLPSLPARSLEARPRLETLEDRTLPSGTPFSADAHRSLTTPTGWWWYHGVDAAFITSLYQANNARITDLEVEGAAPLRFNATLVSNTGAYAKGWWWYYGVTAGQVQSLSAQNNARLIDLETYFVNGERRFAVVMVANAGADAKTWWWYYNVSPTFASNHFSANNTRPVDLEREDNGNLTFVSVANVGNDARGWWYYYNVSPSFVSDKLSQNFARLTDIEWQPNGNMTVVMEPSQGEHSWWYYGYNGQDTLDLALRNGARITDVETHYFGSQKVFAVTMINNSNALTTRVGDLLRNSSGAHNGNRVVNAGAYLKQVGGGVRADLQGFRQFEPASMIKVLIHLHALREVQARRASLNELITYFHPPGNDNPGMNPAQRTPAWQVKRVLLRTALQMMMWQSHNGTTWALQQRFGTARINATAIGLGLAGVRLGSPLPIGAGAAGNFLTLSGTARLYELVALGQAGLTNGSPFTAADDYLNLFYQLMLGPVSAGMATVVREEASRRLGRPLWDPAVQSLANRFLASTRESYKGGSYTLTHPLASYGDYWREVRTEGGWVSLPFRAAGRVVARGYVYGMFVEGALALKSSLGNATRQAVNHAVYEASQGELFRDEIRAAMATW